MLLKYLDLFDSLVELLQCLNRNEIINVLSDITASDIPGINYFTTDFIEKLRECTTTTTSLLKILFPYTNWYDHSIIRKLVEACDCPEGVKLLDEFDSQIDVSLPFIEYPILVPSNLMTPDESSTHTVMVVKCMQSLSSLLLKHIGVVKSLMINKLNIVKHACTLLAVADHSSAVFFWLIPRSVVSTIINGIQEHSGDLLQHGLTELTIYPNFSFLTSNTNQIWTTTFSSDNVTQSKQVNQCNL